MQRQTPLLRPLGGFSSLPEPASGKSRCAGIATLEQIADPLNVHSAALHVARNGGSPGVGSLKCEHLKWVHLSDPERRAIEAFRSRLIYPRFSARSVVDTISRKLRNETWQFSPVLIHRIPKGNGKFRPLGIPTIHDRIIQQAILHVIEPIWDPQFSDSSYAFRKNPIGPDGLKVQLRGQSPAVRKTIDAMMNGHYYALSIDIATFFDSVHHDRLMSLLVERLEDVRIRRLLRKILAQPLLERGFPARVRTVGVPQGGPLSPLLSNIYLDALDKELEKRGHLFVRYADDFIIFLKSRQAAKRVKKSVASFLKSNLMLDVNLDKSCVVPGRGLAYLGFDISVDEGRHKVSVSRKARKSFGANLAKREQEDPESVAGYWKGWLKYFDPVVTEKETLGPLPEPALQPVAPVTTQG